MGVPAPLRRQLRDKIGADVSEGLVTWLEEMRAEHEDKLEQMHAEHIERLARMDARMDAMESRLIERINRLEVRISDVQSNLMKWSFVFWCGAVAAIAALAGVLRQ